MEEEQEKKIEKDIQKETLKPITKVKSKEDKELQEWEVESSGGGIGAGGGPETTSTKSRILRYTSASFNNSCDSRI